jgi:Glu-tRNA(Gln) amidotransferase subunit E-like FAD-binding protein
MATAKRLILSEDDTKDVELTLPDDDVVVVDTPEVLPVEEPVVEPEVKEEVVVNAYTDMLQDLLRKQWDVINSADGIMATIEAESADINKEDVKSILQKLVEDTTVSIGMVTKALGVVDPSQEELMDQGVAKAEEVINQEPIEESVKEPLSEDASDWRAVDFSSSDYYDRFWQEECFYQLQYFWENAEDYADDEDIQELDNLSTDEIKDIIIDAAEEVRNSDYLWEEINERIQDEVLDSLHRKMDELRNTPTVELGDTEKEGE